MKICVYGAQYGSEGKGAFAEYIIKQVMGLPQDLVVLGENAPNSGHTNSMGKTRSLPVSAWYADTVILGPDSAIDPNMLREEVRQIRDARGGTKDRPLVYVHENATIINAADISTEKGAGLMERIGSTLSGGGSARCYRSMYRESCMTMRQALSCPEYKVVSDRHYHDLLHALVNKHWLFECSQGLMLDVNLGRFPYVTSRNTHPKVAIHRNGLGAFHFEYAGVYRTYPIRTGGNTGPTGGEEITWNEVGVEPEIASVTKRTRRVFKFDPHEFLHSLDLVNPDYAAFTHVDYLGASSMNPVGVGKELMKYLMEHLHRLPPSRFARISKYYGHVQLYGSASAGDFIHLGNPFYHVTTPQS